MYTGIQIKNYKNLNVELSNLKNINLIIGPNNSGKTSYAKKQDGPYILSILDPFILETKSEYLKRKFELIRGIS